MAITINSIKCPECGASLPIEEGRTQLFCSYCGAKVVVTNENEYIYRHIDEAELKQAEVRMRELEIEQEHSAQGNNLKKVLTKIWLVLSVIIIGICIIKWAFQDDFADAFLMLFYLGGPVIGGGAYLLFKLMPEKENDKVLLKSGGIKFPKGLEPFTEQYYEVVQAALTNAGFTNVTGINLHDVTFGILQKPGKIQDIKVNGTTITSGGRVYMPNVPVVITYHGK